jgi:hypothetical protein
MRKTCYSSPCQGFTLCEAHYIINAPDIEIPKGSCAGWMGAAIFRATSLKF